jgi:prepilin-type processing-associated H-X9-DG protein
LLLAGPYLESDGPWPRAWSDIEFGEEVLRDFEQFHCPSHPLSGEIPGAFIINAFASDKVEEWEPQGPIKLAQVRDSSNVFWIGEAADQFGTVDPLSGQNHVYRAETHQAWHPEHLPRQPQERISDDRHDGTANVLFFDTSVRAIHRGTLTLSMF